MTSAKRDASVEAPGDGDRGGASGTVAWPTLARTDGDHQESSRDTLTDGHVLRFRVTEQPDPTPNGSRSVWALVMEDMAEREQAGIARYGTPLQAHNGRDALWDAYEECLDMAVYLRQAIEERAA